MRNNKWGCLIRKKSIHISSFRDRCGTTCVSGSLYYLFFKKKKPSLYHWFMLTLILTSSIINSKQNLSFLFLILTLLHCLSSRISNIGGHKSPGGGARVIRAPPSITEILHHEYTKYIVVVI